MLPIFLSEHLFICCAHPLPSFWKCYLHMRRFVCRSVIILSFASHIHIRALIYLLCPPSSQFLNEAVTLPWFNRSTFKNILIQFLPIRRRKLRVKVSRQFSIFYVKLSYSKRKHCQDLDLMIKQSNDQEIWWSRNQDLKIQTLLGIWSDTFCKVCKLFCLVFFFFTIWETG